MASNVITEKCPTCKGYTMHLMVDTGVQDCGGLGMCRVIEYQCLECGRQAQEFKPAPQEVTK